jgi:acyl dehydratase
MSNVTFAGTDIGDELPTHVAGPISRTTLALFAGASGDHNPVHIDIDFAKKSGMDDVFAHGMLSMAYLAQLVTEWVPQQTMREYSARFMSITPLHTSVTCTGRITEKFEAEGEKRVRIELAAHIDDGTQTMQGEVVVALP